MSLTPQGEILVIWFCSQCSLVWITSKILFSKFPRNMRQCCNRPNYNFLSHRFGNSLNCTVQPQDYHEAREYLDSDLPGRWMGRGGAISWPARSPELTPCDYYLWGHIKSIAWRDTLQTINELKSKIREAIRDIGEDIFMRVLKTWKLVWTSLYVKKAEISNTLWAK